MQREKMVGENLRDGVVEVAFEQWTEQNSETAMRICGRFK